MIRLAVRRFFCSSAQCPARTFAEQIEGLTSAYARRTPLLRRMLEAIGLALAGRSGARLAGLLGICVGRSTMLRLIRPCPIPARDLLEKCLQDGDDGAKCLSCGPLQGASLPKLCEDGIGDVIEGGERRLLRFDGVFSHDSRRKRAANRAGDVLPEHCIPVAAFRTLALPNRGLLHDGRERFRPRQSGGATGVLNPDATTAGVHVAGHVLADSGARGGVPGACDRGDHCSSGSANGLLPVLVSE
jgi:hypothetical protein